ncbi:TPA: hypothetical protein DCZ32_02890, partial [Candidatus Uhrbacteria bacterium]|nr:hypothetical protein [Candidatus Uhrbacteria bacterium]
MPLDLSLYPEEVVSFLISGQAVNDASFISEKYKFGPEGIDKLLDAYESVVAKETSLLNLPDLLEKSFGIEKEIAKKVSADLAGRRLLPIDAYVGDVSGAIISWGGKIEDYPKDRVAVRKMSPEQFVSQIADHSGVKMSDKQLEHRLNFILSSFVRGVRTREQATSAMTRAIKVGGLELDAKVADSLVSQIEKEKSFVNIEDQAMPEQPMVSDNAIVSVTSSKSDELVLEQEKQVREEDEELRAAKIITEAVKVPAISVEDAVTRVTAVCKECSANPEIAKRFSDAVSARMREVRDAFETRDLLERSVGEGGIGLSGRALADALSEIEAEFGRMRASQDQP